MEVLLDGPKDRMRRANGHSAPFETTMLAHLCRLRRPARLRPDTGFGTLKRKLSGVAALFHSGVVSFARMPCNAHEWSGDALEKQKTPAQLQTLAECFCVESALWSIFHALPAPSATVATHSACLPPPSLEWQMRLHQRRNQLLIGDHV